MTRRHTHHAVSQLSVHSRIAVVSQQSSKRADDGILKQHTGVHGYIRIGRSSRGTVHFSCG